MNPAHIHIVLAHVPAIGTVFGLILLAYARVRSNQDIFRASLVIFTISGLVALAVYLLGESAEEIVEHTAQISENLIHEHEEVALLAMISGIALGVVSAIGIWLSRRSSPKGLTSVVLIVALITLGIMAVTANRGGQINHPEIRTTAADGTGTGTHQEDDDD